MAKKFEKEYDLCYLDKSNIVCYKLSHNKLFRNKDSLINSGLKNYVDIFLSEECTEKNGVKRYLPNYYSKSENGYMFCIEMEENSVSDKVRNEEFIQRICSRVNEIASGKLCEEMIDVRLDIVVRKIEVVVYKALSHVDVEKISNKIKNSINSVVEICHSVSAVKNGLSLCFTIHSDYYDEYLTEDIKGIIVEYISEQ